MMVICKIQYLECNKLVIVACKDEIKTCSRREHRYTDVWYENSTRFSLVNYWSFCSVKRRNRAYFNEDSLNTVYIHYIMCISGSICFVKEEKYCMNSEKPYDSDRPHRQEGVRRSLL